MELTRKQKRRKARTKRLLELKEQGVPDVTEIPKERSARVPTNMDEVRALLSGRYDAYFREPITEREERKYRKVWRRRGKGLTKKVYSSSETARRKLRQKKRSKKWNERNNRI